MNNLFSPGFWLAALLLALGLLGAGYTVGNKHANTQCTADQVDAQKTAQTEVKAIDTAREAVAVDRESSRELIRIIYRDLKQASGANAIQVDASGANGGDAGCSLDADGLRLWNAANSATAEAVRSQPDYALSTAPAAVEWLDTRHVAKPYRIDGAIRPVPRPAGETGGVLQ